MTGRADGQDPAVRQFLGFAREHQLDLDAFFAVYADGPDAARPIACALAVPGAGRTAMLFTNPLARHAEGRALTAAARAAIGALDPARVRLVQSLTDPPQQAERAALREAGLSDLAELVYLQRYVERGRSQLELVEPGSGRPLKVVHWSESVRPTFERAILRSYEGTLDCPGLLGLRQIDDIIAGHRATGRFDAGLWSVYEFEGEPIAVLLLAHVPAREAYELVYLGVVPAYRGRGLGAVLVRHALASVAARGGGRLHLAVDAANRPAVKLYERHGFRANAHKAAMIFALDD
jgi:ribosomal protein S18 acetylase RimI-like enzyme